MTTTAINKTDRSEWFMSLPRLALLAVRLGFSKDVPWETKTAIGGALLYIISPIDGIPDFIPVVGQLEDMLVAVLLVDGMVNHVDRAVVLRYWTGKPETLDSIGRATRRVTAIVPAFIRERVMKKIFRKNWRQEESGGPDSSGKVVVDA